MIDCYNFRLTNIRPLPGRVLVELQPSTEANGILFHHSVTTGAGGIVRDKMDQLPGQEAIVRKMGEGTMPDGLVLGDRVIINCRAGRQMNQEPRVFKMVSAQEILAKFV